MKLAFKFDTTQYILFFSLFAFGYIQFENGWDPQIVAGGALSSSVVYSSQTSIFDWLLVLPKLLVHQDISHFTANVSFLLLLTALLNKFQFKKTYYLALLIVTMLLETLVILVKHFYIEQIGLNISPVGISSFIYALATITVYMSIKSHSQHGWVVKYILTPSLILGYIVLMFEFLLGLLGGDMSPGHLCGVASGYYFIRHLPLEAKM